jgi:hypothetical protein
MYGSRKEIYVDHFLLVALLRTTQTYNPRAKGLFLRQEIIK